MAWLRGTARRGGPEFLTPNLLSSSQTAGLQDPRRSHAAAQAQAFCPPPIHRPAQESAARGLSREGAMDVSAALGSPPLCFPQTQALAVARRAWRGGCRPRLHFLPGGPRHELGGGRGSRGSGAQLATDPLHAHWPGQAAAHTLGRSRESGWLLRRLRSRPGARGAH